MHEDSEGVHRDSKSQGPIAKAGLKGLELATGHAPAHGAKERRALGEGRRRGGGAGAGDLCGQAGVVGLEGFGPETHEIVHGVRAHGGHGLSLKPLGRFIGRERLIEHQSSPVPKARYEEVKGQHALEESPKHWDALARPVGP